MKHSAWGISRQHTRSFSVRAYLPEDKENIRSLCCDTGYFGFPVESVFQDRKWFADLNTSYYLKFEPDSCFIAEDKDTLIGYIFGTRHPLKHSIFFYLLIATPLILKAVVKSFLGIYDKKSRNYIKQLIVKGMHERPRRPTRTAHFHFNVKKGYRNKGVGRALIRTLLRHFLRHGIKNVYGETLHAEKFRDKSFYTDHGFRFYDKKLTTFASREFGKIEWVTVTARIEELRDIFNL